MANYPDIVLKLVVGFLFITLLINFTGKGNLAPTSAMDQLQNYVLGGIIGGVIYSSTITLAQFIVVLLIWALLILITRYLKTHIHSIGKFIDGQPITIVRNGHLLVENCLRANLSAKDVDFKLRTVGAYDLNQVKRAILEQNGSITVLTRGDEDVRYPVIVDGQVDPDVLELMGKDNTWLQTELKKQAVSNVRQVYMAKYQHGQLDLMLYDNQDR